MVNEDYTSCTLDSTLATKPDGSAYTLNEIKQGIPLTDPSASPDCAIKKCAYNDMTCSPTEFTFQDQEEGKSPFKYNWVPSGAGTGNYISAVQHAATYSQLFEKALTRFDMEQFRIVDSLVGDWADFEQTP